MIRKTIFLFENIIYWYIGLVLATLIFVLSTFYVAPFATGLKIDTDKYVTTTYQKIQQKNQRHFNVEQQGEQLTEEKTSLWSEIYKAFDKGTDNIIKWINKKEEN